MSAEYVQVPQSVWRQMLNDLDFLKKAIVPLAKGYKPSKWMSAKEVMECLNIGRSRLKQLRSSGQIKYQKPANGNAVEYWREDIEDYKAGRIVITVLKKIA